MAFARGVRTGVLTIRMPSDSENLVKRPGELAVPVPDQELDRWASVGPAKGDVAGLLGDPAGSGIGRDARQMDNPGVQIDEDQHVEAAKKHGVDVEEVTGHHGRGLRLQELVPGRSSPPWYGIDAIALQDRPDRRGADGDPHGGQLTVNASIPPGRVLGGQPADKCHRPRWLWWSTRLLRVRPAPLYQVSVPAQQGPRFDQEPIAASPRDEPGQTRDDGPIRRLEGGPCNLATQDHDLVAQHDDFDSHFRAIPAESAKDLKDATEGSVEKGEGHGLGILVFPQASTKVLILDLDAFLAPTGYLSTSRKAAGGSDRSGPV